MWICLVAEHHFAQSDTVDLLIGTEHGSAHYGWDRESWEVITTITHLEISGTIVANHARVVDLVSSCYLHHN